MSIRSLAKNAIHIFLLWFGLRAPSFEKSSSAAGKNTFDYGPHHSFTSPLQELVLMTSRRFSSKIRYLHGKEFSNHASKSMTDTKTARTNVSQCKGTFSLIGVTEITVIVPVHLT